MMITFRILAETANHVAIRAHEGVAFDYTITTFAGICLCTTAVSLLRKKSRLAAGILTGIVLLVMAIFYASFVRTGGIDYTLTIDQSANQFVIAETYAKTGDAVEPVQTYALDQVLRTDLEVSNGGTGGDGGAILTTLRDGTQIYPLGSLNKANDNQMLVLDTIQRHTGQAER